MENLITGMVEVGTRRVDMWAILQDYKNRQKWVDAHSFQCHGGYVTLVN